MLEVHVDDFKIAVTKEITDSVEADLTKRFPPKHLRRVTWYMGSDYENDRETRTLEILQTDSVYSRCCRTFRNHKNQAPSLLLRHCT